MKPFALITPLLFLIACTVVRAETPATPAADPAATPTTAAPTPPASETPATQTRKQSPSAKQWIDWLPPTLPPHEVEWLRDGSVLSLYFPQQLAQAHGSVLVMPPAGQHAAWPDHIRALSEQLPAHGWNVLVVTPAEDALQPAPATTPAETTTTPATPVAAAETDEIAQAAGSPIPPKTDPVVAPAPAEDATASPSLLALRAGLVVLEDKGQQSQAQKNVVLIGMGASGMTALALAQEKIDVDKSIRGLVLADLPETAKPEQKLANILRLQPIAVLDISHPDGRDALQRRAAQLKQFHTYYTVLLPEPLATIQQANDRFARRLRGWLMRYVPDQPQAQPASGAQ